MSTLASELAAHGETALADELAVEGGRGVDASRAVEHSESVISAVVTAMEAKGNSTDKTETKSVERTPTGPS